MRPHIARHYKIRGMDCAEEAAVLKREVGRLVGGADRRSFDILKARGDGLRLLREGTPRALSGPRRAGDPGTA